MKTFLTVVILGLFNFSFSQKWKEMANDKNINLLNITGKKGTVILVDTTYIHRGNIIKNGERKAFTQYFF